MWLHGYIQLTCLIVRRTFAFTIIRHPGRATATYFASKLCIIPSYLSDICREVGGYAAGYWIDRFTVDELSRLLTDRKIPFGTIIQHLIFSSFSYFSRYTIKRLGMTLTRFRGN